METVKPISSITAWYLVIVGIAFVLTLLLSQPTEELRGVPLAMLTAPASFVVAFLATAFGDFGASSFGGFGRLLLAVALNAMLVEWVVRRSRHPKRNVA